MRWWTPGRGLILHFEVPDPDAEARRLSDAGYPVELEPTDTDWGTRSVIFRGPGNILVDLCRTRAPETSMEKPLSAVSIGVDILWRILTRRGTARARRGTVGLLIHLLILPIRRPIVAILLGLAIIGGVLAYDWNQAPTCGGETMDRTSVCHRVTDSAGTYDKTYDEKMSNQTKAPYIWGALGGVLVLGGAVSWPIRRRRAARATADAAH